MKPLPFLFERWRRWCAAHPTGCFLLASACLVLLLYRNALAGGFVYDDVDHILHNPALASWSSLWQRYVLHGVSFSADYRTGPAGAFYRPLFWLSLGLDRRFFGTNPAWFHLTNLMLHWGNGCLGFLLLKRLGFAERKAGAAMLLWLALPINTEAVVWISGRSYLLATFFILSGLLAAASYLEKTRVSRLLLFGGAQICALLAHEMGILLLPLVLLLACTQRKLLTRSSLVLAATAGGIDLFYVLWRASRAASLPLPGWSLAAAGATFWKYLLWMALPIQMSVERSNDTPTQNWSLGAVLLLGALALFLAGNAWLAWKRPHLLPEVPAAVAWIILSLGPYLGVIFLYQGMAERYTYLASLGLAVAVSSLLWMFRKRGKPILVWGLALWVGWGVWRLDARVREWHDEISLFSSSLRADPDSPVLLYGLALAMEEAGDLRTSFLLTKRAAELKPNYEKAINSLGTTYLRLNQLKQAKAQFERATALRPNDESATGNLGVVYLRLGLLRQAREQFKRAAALDPSDFEALSNLGLVNERLGDLPGAERDFRRAIALAPKEVIARCDLAMVLFRQGRWDEASAELALTIQQHPRDANGYYFFGLIDQQMGAREAAIDMFEQAVRLKPDFVEAQAKLIELRAR